MLLLITVTFLRFLKVEKRDFVSFFALLHTFSQTVTSIMALHGVVGRGRSCFSQTVFLRRHVQQMP